MRLRVVLAILFFVSGVATARDPAEIKLVPFDRFMAGRIASSISIPISIPVPTEYKAATLSEAPSDYSYWMRPRDVRKANKSGDLPSDAGYMYGKISLDVGYDKSADLFLGIEEPARMAEWKKEVGVQKAERFHVGDHAVLLLTSVSPGSGARAYAMYVATNIDTNAVYIAFRPAGNSEAVGEFVWAKLRRSLSGPN